jgi:peptidoglycan biosynthesis protein MviN/MurJ (putative lipid II flippase)
MMPRRLALRAIAVTSLGAVLGVVTLARDVYVGRLYGFSPEIKNYTSAVLLSVILINSAGGALASSYTPFFYQRSLVAGGLAIRWPLGRVFRDSAPIVVAAYVSVVALRELLGNLLPTPSSTFSGSRLGDDVALCALMLVALYSRSVNALLLAQERYVASTLSQCVVPVASVAYLAFGALPTRYAALVHALAVGYIAQAMFCFIVAGRHVSGAPSGATAAPTRDLVGRFAAMFAGALVLALLEYIEVVFASLRSAEAVAPVNYASRIVALLLGFVMAGTGNILTLKFIEIGADRSALRRPLIHLLYASGAVGIAVCVVAWFAAAPLVRIAYAGGALAPSELDLLASYIAHYSLGVPPALVGFAAGRALVARGRQSNLLLGALATVLTSVVCNTIFLEMGLPAGSVVLASVCGYACSATLLTWLAFADSNNATTR